jgi:hypothetical protein
MFKNVLLNVALTVCAITFALGVSAQKSDLIRDGIQTDSKANPQAIVQTMKSVIDRHNNVAGQGRSSEEGFEGDFLPACWTSIDADGDGQAWFPYGFAGTAYEGLISAASASWTGPTGPLTPDNYLVSPPLIIGPDEILSFYIASQDPNWPAEKYGIYVSTTGNLEADFTDELWTETLTDDVWQSRELDMSDYEGEEIYIAFRHFDVTDQFYIKLDQIVLPGEIAVCVDCNAVVYPSVEVEAITCAADGSGWNYNLDLTGGEGTFTFSNSANGDVVMIDGFTLVEAGPFANGEAVTFTITSDGSPTCSASFTQAGDCTEPCESFVFGPFPDLVNAVIPVPNDEGVCEVLLIDAFEIWAGEAYLLDGLPEGVMYEFNACSGPAAGTWVVTFTILDPAGEVVAFGTDGDGCSISWNTSVAGDYLLLVNRAGYCGSASQINNGNPEITCSALTTTIDRVVVDAKIYPNPAVDQINVATALQGDAQVRMFDAVGRLVAQRNIHLNGVSFVQDINGLEKGMYMMEITTSNRIATEKFIKQ